jgi:uncharacterized membrane protein
MTTFPRLVIAALVLLSLLWALWLTQVVQLSFHKLGLSPAAGLLVLLASLFGGVVNIPICRRRVVVHDFEPWSLAFPWLLEPDEAVWPWGRPWFPWRLLFYRPPQVREQIIYLNLGGAVIPLLVSLYLLPRAPLLPLLVATGGVAFVCYLAARPVRGAGIIMPAFIPPLTAAALALVLAPGAAPPVAYIAGTVGALIGADLLHLRDLELLDAQVLSIGGAGVHDGIFFAGVVAVLLS